MKLLNLFAGIIFLILCACTSPSSKIVGGEKKDVSIDRLGQTPIVLAYIVAGNNIMPDPNYVTHLNYAFGHVAETFDRVIISNEERLTKITDLKKSYPKLKVLLSIGGWTSGNFSEMAADNQKRLSFAKDCKRVVDQFNLDGIDLDWEYPGTSVAGISSSPDDVRNFTLLIRDIRKEIGETKLLTLATVYSARYIDFKGIDPYIDFINIMTYDMGRPPYHNSPLYKSEHTKSLSADESVDAHLAAGVPLHKLTLGMPFYGHGIDAINDFVDYKDISSLKGYTSLWDSIAQVPYLVDRNGKFVCSYDDEQSLKLKCEYLLKKGMLGAMYWEYSADDNNGTLRKIVYNTVRQKK